ncbi:MAG: sigma 54-interacting transcriptional regulator [Deltaproteobacteria bacterium]|nr:sigma 54-interacting transcriptional regulator [Deltaproteobacteria bacterium]
MVVDEKEFFRQATLEICSSLDIEKALFNSFTYICKYIPADQMNLNFFNENMSEGIIYAIATHEGSKIINLVHPYSQKEKKVFFDPDRTPDLLLLNSAEGLPIAQKALELLKRPDSSFLGLRLRIDGQLKGSINLLARGKNRFTQEHLHLFSLLKDPWTIVLINNRQYRELLDLKELIADDNRYLRKELQLQIGEKIIGSDKGLKNVVSMLRHVAPQNSPVLLLGETGVGKEVFALAIHHLSSRSEGPFIKVNCGAIPETLIDSELFGHEKGAFTGAVSQKRGRFERAQKGTIFLDEIGELPLPAQVRLLRVLEDKTIERVGGSEPLALDIRIIAATHRNLKNMIESGSFREDLYYRLNVFPIEIPPLRHRKSDLSDLAEYFIRKKSIDLGRYPLPALAPGAVKRLMAYDWPGNVRELENTIERALILNKDPFLDFDPVHHPGLKDPVPDQHQPHLRTLKFDEMAFYHISQILKSTDGRIQGKGGAAEILGINPGTLRHKMRMLGIPFGRKIKAGKGSPLTQTD